MDAVVKLDRREFVKLGAVAGTGLFLGIRLPARVGIDQAAPFAPNAFLQIDPSGAVTIWVGRSDMVMTSSTHAGPGRVRRSAGMVWQRWVSRSSAWSPRIPSRGEPVVVAAINLFSSRRVTRRLPEGYPGCPRCGSARPRPLPVPRGRDSRTRRGAGTPRSGSRRTSRRRPARAPGSGARSCPPSWVRAPCRRGSRSAGRGSPTPERNARRVPPWSWTSRRSP